jgi:diguanylate cyclase (GGDEF)-like protein/PAS domain S-box-containing protein
MQTNENGAARRHRKANRRLPWSPRATSIITHFLLATIGVSAVVACVIISLVIISIQNQTLKWNTTWTDRINQIVALRSSVDKMGLQADAILDNFSPEELKQFNTMCDGLDANITAFQSEITTNKNLMDLSMNTRINGQITDILQLIATLRKYTVLGVITNGENRLTTVSPMDLDREQMLMQDAITTMTTYIRSEQILQQQQSLISARYWINWLYVVCGIAIPFMFALAVLNVLMSHRLQRTVKERERTLEELYAYQTAIDHHAIISVTDMQGRITQANEAFCQISKFPRQEIIGKNPRVTDSQFHPRKFWSDMWQTISSGIVWHGDVCNQAKDGSQYWVATTVMPVLNELGRPNSYISIATDITKQKSLETELRIAARTDKLTGLPNRAAMTDYIQSAMARERRHPEFCFAVLFLDIDRFKSVNDCLSHEAGDLLLCEIASRLRLALREEDMVAVATPADDVEITQHKCGEVMRLGGDEFVVLLDALQAPEDACVVADRILANMAAPFLIQGTQIYSRASIGIVTSKTSNLSVSDVLRDADIAMYEAKFAGSGGYVVFDEKMRLRGKRRINLESDLRGAAEKGELLLHYQPLICLRNNKVYSYEALIRWNHPQYGMISPAEFIPIAEESGLIIPIGKWVLRESCRQLAQWRAMHGGTTKFPRINVNVSRNQLMHGDFSSTIVQILNEFNIEPSSLYLEITEGTLMRDTTEGGRVLRSLTEIGLKISLDDFGTGYSSLSSLNEFPVHEIKIDRSFIANMTRGRDCFATVQAIVSLTQKLGVGVVAEGIETVDQLLMLQSINCRLGQGYLFAKPMPPEEIPYFSCATPSKAVGREAADELQFASIIVN